MTPGTELRRAPRVGNRPRVWLLSRLDTEPSLTHLCLWLSLVISCNRECNSSQCSGDPPGGSLQARAFEGPLTLAGGIGRRAPWGCALPFTVLASSPRCVKRGLRLMTEMLVRLGVTVRNVTYSRRKQRRGWSPGH